MTSINQQDILFDDFSALQSLAGHKALHIPSLNANCDCAGYTSSQDDEDCDTTQIARAAIEAN